MLTKTLSEELSTLSKGDSIPKEQLEKYFGVEEGTVAFGLKSLGLCERIMMEKEQAGETVTVCMKKGSLHVLDDASSSNYNSKAFEAGIRKCNRSNRRMLAVDTSSLSLEQKNIHIQKQLRQSRILQGMELGKKNLLPA